MAVKVLGVADSDSYLKWLAAGLDQLPAGWSRDIVLFDGPAAPSARQVEAALSGSSFTVGTCRTMTLGALRRAIAAERPDVVFLAARGGTVAVVLREAIIDAPDRPALVTGLPGISIPATIRGLEYRAGVDLFVLHSRREVADFESLAAGTPLSGRFALASLPFLKRHPPGTEPATRSGRTVIFAPQALVPTRASQRTRILSALAELGRRRPDLRIVIKERTVEGETQTHREQHAYPSLIARGERLGMLSMPDNVQVHGGAMGPYLSDAIGMVSVSSTALIESLAANVPVLVLGDFGISDGMINTVFYGSGLLGNLDDLVNADFRYANEQWLDNNYFHDFSANDWLPRLESLVEARAAGAPATPLRQVDPLGIQGYRNARYTALKAEERTLSDRIFISQRTIALKSRSFVRRASGFVSRQASRPFAAHRGFDAGTREKEGPA